MAKKFNPEKLQEEVKRFRLISEYSFYTEKDDTQKTDDLILGAGLSEDGDDQPDPNADPNAAPDANADDASAPAPDAGDDNLFGTDEPADDAGTPAPDANAAPPAAAPAPPPPPAPPAEPEVDVDVTQLVKSSDEAAKISMETGQKTDELMAKFSDLEQRVSNMDTLSSKIDTLEKEIVKRNPTPVERLEMRSLDSFPFNIRLSDYWNDKIEGYDPRGGDDEPKEYVLTKDDVDAGFTDMTVKKSLDEPNDYDEEDIY